VIEKLRAFGAFWYDFIVGDDWRVAAGVSAALVITYAVSRSTTSTWWVVPLAVLILLPYSLWRGVRRT
jgi:tryptophan-rich sensory protein